MNFYRIRKIWNTALYQGAGKRKNYFEGWYFKHVSPAGKVYSVIPGIARSREGKHAFIQTIDGGTAETHYVTYPYQDFSFRRDRFDVTIGLSHFSRKGIVVDLTDGDFRFQADLVYQDTRELPFSLINPNAMGWYSFMPFMECYHGLVSMDHAVEGFISCNGKRVSFDGGRGYIEKDWGKSFPSSWVWMQSNSFDNPGDSFMLSIARIPWLGSYFVGFLGFLSVSGKVYKFATYTGAVLKSLGITESEVAVEIQAGKIDLKIHGRKNKKGYLQAPINGVMERRISESIDAVITVEMNDRKGKYSFNSAGTCGGLEIVGDPEELQE